MIRYVRRLSSGKLLVVSDAGKVELDEPLTRWFSRLAEENLSTWEGRILAVKRQFGLRSRVPLYLAEDCLLLPVRTWRSPEAFYLNYHAVRSWEKDAEGNAVVRFADRARLSVGSWDAFRRRMAEGRRIEEFRTVGEGK